MKLKTEFGKFNVSLYVDRYAEGSVLYIGLIDDDTKEPFANLTRNIPDQYIPCTIRELNSAPVDVNNCPWAEEFIKKYKLGSKTETLVHSGFCTYPVYQFDERTLKKFQK